MTRLGWSERPIAALANYENGYPFKPHQLADTGTPIVRIRQLNDPSAGFDHYEGDLEPKYQISDGDLIFSWSGSLSVGFWTRGNAFLNQHLFRVDPASGVDKRWLAYALTWSVARFEGFMHGSAMTHITKPMMKVVRAPVPPVDEQRAIADYLDRETARIDTLIEEQQRLIDMLRERRAAEIATAFYPPFNARLRYAIEFAQTGPFGTQLSADEYVEGGIPVINPSHITRGAIAPDPAIAVSSAKAQALERHKLKVGDLVLGRKGDVDKCALVGEREAGFLCGSDSMLLRPGGSTDATFLWWFLQSTEAHSQLDLWSVGSTVAGLNQTTIAKVGLPLPALDEQRTTAVYLDEQTAKTDELIAETERFIELSRERRAALITAAVTGQIDVREVA